MKLRPRRQIIAAAAIALFSAAAAVAAPALAQAPALRSDPVTSETIDLAARLRGLEWAGRRPEEMATLGVASMVPLLGEPKPGLLEAYKQAVVQSPDVIADMGRRTIEVYSASYTDQELRALIDHLETPLGRAVHEKRLTSLPQRPVLTAEEAAAEQAFISSAVGRSIAAKKLPVQMALMSATADVAQRLSRNAMMIYCASHACSEKTLERLSSSEASPEAGQ